MLPGRKVFIYFFPVKLLQRSTKEAINKTVSVPQLPYFMSYALGFSKRGTCFNIPAFTQPYLRILQSASYWGLLATVGHIH